MVARNSQGYRIGEGHHNAKASDALVAQVVSEYVPRVMGCKKLAKKYHISANTIKDWIYKVARNVR